MPLLLTIENKGHKDRSVFTNVTKMHRAINQILSEVSITYEPKMNLTLRHLQKRMQHLEENKFTIYQVENSIVRIDKLPTPE